MYYFSLLFFGEKLIKEENFFFVDVSGGKNRRKKNYIAKIYILKYRKKYFLHAHFMKTKFLACDFFIKMFFV